MTLSARNLYFRGGVILAALSLGCLTICGYIAFQVFPDAAGRAASRSLGIIHSFAIADASSYVPFWTMVIAALYSLISITLIYYFFEKTQAPEILFIGFFVISLAFEFARIIIPLKEAIPVPNLLVITASRVLLFGRYFGLFSLFAAAVYAAGLDAQKQETFLLMLVLSALIIAMNVPIDSLVWDSTFMLWNGYRTMLIVIESVVLVITIVSFLISAYIKSSKSYIYIGIGIFLAYAGRFLLLNSDNWITPIPGLVILAAGTWFACSRLHLEYLWL